MLRRVLLVLSTTARRAIGRSDKQGRLKKPGWTDCEYQCPRSPNNGFRTFPRSKSVICLRGPSVAVIRTRASIPDRDVRVVTLSEEATRSLSPPRRGRVTKADSGINRFAGAVAFWMSRSRFLR